MLVGLYKKTTVQSSPEIRAIAQMIIIHRFLPILEAAAKDQNPFDALELSLATAMDFITAYLFGISNSVNFLQDVKTRQRWLAVYRSTKPFSFWPLEFPGLTSLLSRLGIDLVPPKVILATNEVKDLCFQMLNKVESSPLDSPKGMSYEQLVRQLTPAYGDGYQLRLAIASEHMDNIMAGTETTGWSLTYILHELSLHQSIQSSLRSELLSISPQFTYDLTSSTVPELPSFRALEALPLLDAVVIESLRLHPAVPGPQPRVTSSPPVSLGGYDNIPCGIRVSAQAYSLHRNAKVFPEPEAWKPDRWLHASKEETNEMMRWFWTFGSGSRMCVGSAFALLG
jgi:cytochrome P450